MSEPVFARFGFGNQAGKSVLPDVQQFRERHINVSPELINLRSVRYQHGLLSILRRLVHRRRTVR